MQRLRVGDRVKVISGKDKGKDGVITRIYRDEGRVLVAGINVVKKHQKPKQAGEKGQIVTQEAPIASCKVMPIDPQTGKATRVKIKVQDGKKVRVAKSGAVITPEG